MFKRKRKRLHSKFKNRRQESKNKSKNQGSRIKTFSRVLALITILFSISYLLFFSNFFTVSSIRLVEETAENHILGDTIIAEISPELKGKKIFKIEEGAIEQIILETFSEIQIAKINKKYPKTITLEFEKYPLVANVVNESSSINKTYIINQQGQAIKEDLQKNDLPFIKIKSEEPLNTETALIKPEKLKYILEAISYFQDRFSMKVVAVRYKPQAREIHLFTEKEFYIWLDIQQTFETQLKKLKKAIVKLDIYNEPLEYIDLRIAGEGGDKIIYKRK